MKILDESVTSTSYRTELVTLLHRRGDHFNGVRMLSHVRMTDHVIVASCSSVLSTSIEHGESHGTVTTLDKSLSSVLVTNATSSTPPPEVRVTKAEVRLPDTTNHCLTRDLEIVASVNGSIAIPSVVTTAHTQISYTAAQLFYYGEVTTVPLQRCVRKRLFTLNLWRPSVNHHKKAGANHRNLVNVVNNSLSCIKEVHVYSTLAV